MLTAQLGHRHTAFGLPQDRDDLRISVSAGLHSKSPRSSCRENSTYAAPYFQGGLPYTLIETAKLNTVDPNAWLADTLVRIPDYKITKVTDLLPWRWNR